MTTCRLCSGQQRCSCSRKTSLKVRAHLRNIAKKGAAQSAYIRRVKSWQRWVGLVKGLTVREAWRKIYRLGYNAGYERRRREETRTRREQRGMA
jgi:hypothetical protein